ncbi:MAG: antitoxin VapB family protein [Candidatus Bathycorpusculaceae bacterium]
MARTIAVSDDVYDLLVKSKLPNESFSDVIRRSLKKGMKLSDIACSKTISSEDWERVVKVFEAQRKLDEEKRKKLLE